MNIGITYENRRKMKNKKLNRPKIRMSKSLKLRLRRLLRRSQRRMQKKI